jgi:hypothetical protein
MFKPELSKAGSSHAAPRLGFFVGFAFVALAGTSGCISDTDCGVCDPDHLVLESVSGINYSNRKIHILNGVDKGKYFIEDISTCLETEEAQDPLAAPRGAEEWCKLSPLTSWQGLEFVFNNLLDPTSIELVRKDPSNPNLFEIYDWKTRIASIEGPLTRFNGDYVEYAGDEPDLITRSINLTCIDNLRDMGMDFDHTVLDANPTICNGFREDGLPLKMQPSGTIHSYGGASDWRAASCAAPEEGADTCCTVCDYELSVNVAKYGVDGEGNRRTPETALTCTPGGNVYEDCAAFVVDVNRSAEVNRYLYDWGNGPEEFRLPKSDKVRETHPDQRPAGAEPDGHPCQTDADCDAFLGSDSGAACIGTTPMGVTCDADTDECGNKHCKAEWFVDCIDDSGNTGGAYCVDRRFKDKGAGACFQAGAEFTSCEMDGTCTQWPNGDRLARCDAGEFPDGDLTAAECCQDSLQSGTFNAACDPLFQDNIVPIPRFDRDRTLPEETRDCFCGDPSIQHPACAAQVEKFCTAPWGNLNKEESNEGQYITRFVSKVGGVVYDPSLKGVLYLPADRGNQPRSLVESCAELATNLNSDVEGRNIQDGWRMHDAAFYETFEDFDRGMCSASEYNVVFATEGQEIRDKVGNKLEDNQLNFTFQTPEFHVVPGTGFPTDNLRIGACDDFEVRVSNKYDLDPQNLRKIELVQIQRLPSGEDNFGESCDTSLQPECWQEQFVVAGGLNCTNEPTEVSETVPPCLTVDVALHREGSIRVVIDSVRFGVQLYNLEAGVDEFGREITGRYRMRVPGIETAEGNPLPGVDSFDDLVLDGSNSAHLEAYNRAFHDVCGMPLITKVEDQAFTDFYYDFTVDEPKCKEDEDGDGVQLSCDNARFHYNPFQEDQDLDSYGDVVDLCVLTPSDSNTADSDKDGVGNDCDTCRQTIDKYNLDDAMVDDPRMWVRNIPFQFDTDQDGIGDVCDNCVPFANCGIFGEDTPHSVGVPVPYDDEGVCQNDVNMDMIGDECIDTDTNMPYNLAWAAGAIGFGPMDDFDQDGINNFEDSCPRQPVATVNANEDQRTICMADNECEANASCAPTAANDGNRYCDHVDTDNDGVGDFCDTCPYEANPMQVTDTGMQIDDEDGDFVGSACETNSACDVRPDARPYAFMEVAVDGQCCVTTYPGDGVMLPPDADGKVKCEGLCDPDGFPIKLDCPESQQAIPGEHTPETDPDRCRQLPAKVSSLPGVVTLPPGCETALADAGLCAQQGEDDPNCPLDMANRRLTLLDVPDENELWGKMCFLPQWDQDFDAIGDECDLCDYAFDPLNEPYIDENTGKLWDTIGRFCAGSYAPDAICAAEDGEDTETGTGTDGDATGGSGG